jgi:hypothetical protein
MNRVVQIYQKLKYQNNYIHQEKFFLFELIQMILFFQNILDEIFLFE